MRDGLYHQYLCLLQETASTVNGVFREELAWGELTPLQVIIMQEIAGPEAGASKNWQERLRQNSALAEQAIKTLIGLTYVERAGEKLILTELGARMCEVTVRRFGQIEKAMLSVYTEEQLAHQVSFLVEFQTRLEQNNFISR